MIRVSFETAKALKEAGYPQNLTDEVYVTKDIDDIYEKGDLEYRWYEAWENDSIIDAPFVMEAWLWLWREKKEYLEIEHEGYPHTGVCLTNYVDAPFYDPEEAIKKAIEYLVTNNLIK